MSEEDKNFLENYEKLLDKGYCDCNEMNCIDFNSPRRLLNITKNLQQRIDKAIDFIDMVYEIGSYSKSTGLDDEEIKELYSILQGKE